MKYKILWALILITMIFIGPKTSYAIPKTFPHGEPTGFREMKWGDDISNYPEIKLLVFADRNTEELCNVNEDLNIFNSKANNIIYKFYRNKFKGVEINYSLNDYDRILNAADKKWGQQTANNKSNSQVFWEGKKIFITIEKNKFTKLKISYLGIDYNVNPSYKEREFGRLYIEPKGLNGLYIGDSFAEHERKLIFSYKDSDYLHYNLRDIMLGFDVVEKAIPDYIFLNNKLAEINVLFFGKTNFIKLLNSLEQQFGKANSYSFKNVYMCKWNGIDVELCLTYYGKNDRGRIRIIDNNI